MPVPKILLTTLTLLLLSTPTFCQTQNPSPTYSLHLHTTHSNIHFNCKPQNPAGCASLSAELNNRYKPSIGAGLSLQRTSHLGFADLNLGVQLHSIRYVISGSISANLDPRAGALYPGANFIHIQRSDLTLGFRQTLSIPLFTAGSFQLQGMAGLGENLYLTTRHTVRHLADEDELGKDISITRNDYNMPLALQAIGGLCIPIEISEQSGAVIFEAGFGLTDYFNSSTTNSTLITYAIILSANL